MKKPKILSIHRTFDGSIVCFWDNGRELPKEVLIEGSRDGKCYVEIERVKSDMARLKRCPFEYIRITLIYPNGKERSLGGVEVEGERRTD